MSPETPQEGRFAARVAEFEAIAGSLYAAAVHAGHTAVAENVKDLWQSLSQWTTSQGEVPPILVSAALSGGLTGDVQGSIMLGPVPPDQADELQKAADSAVDLGTKEHVKQALDWLAEHTEEATRIVVYVGSDSAVWVQGRLSEFVRGDQSTSRCRTGRSCRTIRRNHSHPAPQRGNR